VKSGRLFSSTRLEIDSESLSEEERLMVCDHFVRAGQMEHASIAAFARFTLQLLQLGAPAHLLEEASRAQGDETRHAAVCFELAHRYGGWNLAPDKLPLTGVLEDVSFEEILRLCILEGCVGESTAALEATRAAELAEDETLQEQLRQIADDELRHAALAFRFVAWALQQRPELESAVAHLFQEAAQDVRRRPKPVIEANPSRAARLRLHGVLSQTDVARVAEAAHEIIIAPCLQALFEGSAQVQPAISA
jgi:rubrerythrin